MSTSDTLGTRRASRRPSVAILPARRTVLVVRVGDQAYGFEQGAIREVVAMAELIRPSNLPSVLAGFLNVGATLIPVLRVDRLFGMPDSALGMYTPLLLLRDTASPLALLVDEVNRFVSVAVEEIHAVPDNHVLNDCVVGVFPLDGRNVLILSAHRLLSEKEQQCLAELQDREQVRLLDLETPLR